MGLLERVHALVAARGGIEWDGDRVYALLRIVESVKRMEEGEEGSSTLDS